jgi:hypothetical protein
LKNEKSNNTDKKRWKYPTMGISGFLPGKVGFGLRPHPSFPGKKEFA